MAWVLLAGICVLSYLFEPMRSLVPTEVVKVMWIVSPIALGTLVALWAAKRG